MVGLFALVNWIAQFLMSTLLFFITYLALSRVPEKKMISSIEIEVFPA